MLLGGWGSQNIEGWGVCCGQGCAAGISHQSPQVRHQGREAVHRRAIVKNVPGHLGQCRFGARRWRHRVAGCLGLLVGIGEHQFAPGGRCGQGRDCNGEARRYAGRDWRSRQSGGEAGCPSGGSTSFRSGDELPKRRTTSILGRQHAMRNPEIRFQRAFAGASGGVGAWAGAAYQLSRGTTRLLAGCELKCGDMICTP